MPETTTLEEQLEAFRERRSHFALVVDEYGALQGMVTLEDILDEIFGDIPDQDTCKGARRHPPATRRLLQYRRHDADPRTQPRAGLEPARRRSDTMAGLVIHEARTIPEVGQRFAFYGYKFEILRRQRNQITALRVMAPAKPISNGERMAG